LKVMQPFTTVLSGGKVVVPVRNEADSLINDGYGIRVNGLLELESAEALYNIERGKIMVVDEKTNRNISFSELLHIFLDRDPKSWTRFLVYKDLRTRGFIARRDFTLSTDLVVYERGSFNKELPLIRVAIVSEGSPENIEGLLELAQRTEKDKLQLKLAVVDRRGETVYYSLSERKFGDVIHQPI
jgi:tRNA-intron endonuclease, archaea type